MKTIYRYEINNNSGVNRIKMPTSAKILKAGISGESPIGTQKLSIWALVDTEDTISERTFIVAGTGANLDEAFTFEYQYIGSVCIKSVYTFHVFEIKDNTNII